MARIAYELQETYASITRPVVYEVVKQLIEKLNIPNEKITIAYPGSNGKLNVFGSTVDDVNTPGSTPSRERFHITVKEDYSEEDLLTMTSGRGMHPPIFHDKNNNIMMNPVYSRMKVSIDVAYRSRDRYAAESVRDNWRRKIAENREYMVFSARYTYPIPEHIVTALRLLFDTRAINNKDYVNYIEYLHAMGVAQFTFLTNVAGKGDTLAVAEVQENIYGNFTDPGNPAEIEKEDQGAAWLSSFNFEFYYDKPISISLSYPIVIDNELIHYALYPKPTFDISTLNMRAFLPREYYTKIMEMSGYQWHVKGPFIRIPDFDDFTPKDWNDCKTLLSVLLTVEEENPKAICNLTDMGDYGLHSLLVPYFKEYHAYLNKLYEFPFYISLFKEEINLADDSLYIDEALNIESKHALSKHHVQHLTVSIVKDINKLTPAGRKRFFSSPGLVNAWLDIMCGRRPEGGYPRLLNGQTYDPRTEFPDPPLPRKKLHVDVNHFMDICKQNLIYPTARHEFKHPGHVMATVGIFTITTHRQQS